MIRSSQLGVRDLQKEKNAQTYIDPQIMLKVFHHFLVHSLLGFIDEPK